MISCPPKVRFMQLADFQPLALIATTPAGIQQLQRLIPHTPATLWIPSSLIDLLPIPHVEAKVYTSLAETVPQLWTSHRGLVFALATGAVIRLIAPCLRDKATDPAVVVVETTGRYVISLCGGHQGGGDRLTRSLAHLLQAEPIITGAAASLDLAPVDLIGNPLGWRRGQGDWTGVSAAIARGEIIQISQDAGVQWWSHYGWQLQESQYNKSPQAQVWISPYLALANTIPQVQWHPRVLWVGIGCERGSSLELLQWAIQEALKTKGLAQEAIAGLATIDIKADEVGLVALADQWQLPLVTFPANLLASVPVPTPSAIVELEVGTASVAEAAAIVAAATNFPQLGKVGYELSVGSTSIRVRFRSDASFLPTDLNLGASPLLPKQIYRRVDQPGAVTVAIAQAEIEYTGRTGKLWLIGTGPGALTQITPAAQQAIAQADVVIGYTLYLELIQPLLQPQQIVESSPITQERQRAERAIALATWGLTVAVVSSGDCGIYGMAGLVLEQLQQAGWDGKTPAVQVFPGITALQSAASLVGAPLMHDFCAVSLSDLLTPWEVIVKRLNAAAQADFVIALYNPKSQNRVEQITTAQQICLGSRSPETPVAIVRAAYRPDQEIHLTTLGKMLETSIDMLTVVIIGNQSSSRHGDWLITPRGYLGGV
jgi:cobalt-precorrin 5A hydrolase/precorrin-3B C17-methyltransferase